MSVRTSTRPGPVDRAEAAGEQAGRGTVFEALARAGVVARGGILAGIGGLAVKLAVGAGGKTTDQRGALETIAHQPLGKGLLILVAVGLGGYALWRLFHALFGQGPESSDSGFERVAALGSGIAYAAIC